MSHKGQIDKLELDLQRHRDMLLGVQERVRVVEVQEFFLIDREHYVTRSFSLRAGGLSGSSCCWETSCGSACRLDSGGLKRSFVPLPAFFIANCEFVWGSRTNFAFLGSRSPWVFSNSFKVVTHSSSCDFKPPFVGSSIEAPSSSSNGPVFGRSMISTGASSLAGRSMTQAGSGDPQCGQSMCMSGSSSVALRSTCSSAAGGPLCGRGTLPLGASSLVARSMRDPGSSSSALRSKSTSGAGCPMFGHGFWSSVSSSLAVKSTSRRSAGSSDPGTCSSALKGKVWNSS